VPGPGSYVTAPFNLSSFTTLDVRFGATVFAQGAVDDWPLLPPLPSYVNSRDGGVRGGYWRLRYQPFVLAAGVGVRIIGGGTIDGNGWAWWMRDVYGGGPQQGGRPALVEVFECTDAVVAGVTLRDSAFWTLHLFYSRGVHVRGVTVRAPRWAPNADGVDADSSEDVLIEDCDIACGDDHVAIKSGLGAAGRAFGRPARNVTVRGNVHRHGAGIAIGSEVSGGVENVFIYDVRHVGPSKRGFHVKTSPGRGGYVRNVHVRNVSFGEITQGAAISVTTTSGDPRSEPKLDKALWTKVSGLHFDGVTRTAAKLEARGRAVDIQCFPHLGCSDVTFGSIDLGALDGWCCDSVSASSTAGPNARLDACLRRGAPARLCAFALFAYIIALIAARRLPRRTCLTKRQT